MQSRRIRRTGLVTTAAGLCFAAGCFGLVPESKQSDSSKPEPTPAKQPAQPQHRQQQQPVDRQPDGAHPLAGQPQQGNPPPHNPPPQSHVAQRPAVNPAPYRPPASAQYIQLSAGAALPQSLPQGTVMSFSAEYRFVGSPKDGVRYVFVVQGRSGKTVRAVLPNLKSSGQLPGLFTPNLRPGDEPFKGFIEEWPASTGRVRPGDGKRVSNIVPLS